MDYPTLPATNDPAAMVEPLAKLPFVHLRNHTAYSLAQGANKIANVATWCKGFAMPACAITDTGNMFGALEFASALSDVGVQPIIGALLGVEGDDADAEPDRLVLLAQDEDGYQNLVQLVSRAHLTTQSGHEPRVARADFYGQPERLGGMIALSGALDSAVGRLLAAGQAERALAELERLRGVFDGRLYIELQRHALDTQLRIEPTLLAFAERLSLPLVGTNDVHFKDPSAYEAHDVLMCIAQGATIATEHRRRVTREHWFKGPTDMARVFADVPEAYINTAVIAQRCAVRPRLRDPILPAFTADASLEGAELIAQARSGLDARLAQVPTPPAQSDAHAYRERLEEELGIINAMGFPGYFLIVADFIKWAKAQGIPVGPGRGRVRASSFRSEQSL